MTGCSILIFFFTSSVPLLAFVVFLSLSILRHVASDVFLIFIHFYIRRATAFSSPMKYERTGSQTLWGSPFKPLTLYSPSFFLFFKWLLRSPTDYYSLNLAGSRWAERERWRQLRSWCVSLAPSAASSSSAMNYRSNQSYCEIFVAHPVRSPAYLPSPMSSLKCRRDELRLFYSFFFFVCVLVAASSGGYWASIPYFLLLSSPIEYV